jgi:hypothetical protein
MAPSHLAVTSSAARVAPSIMILPQSSQAATMPVHILTTIYYPVCCNRSDPRQVKSCFTLCPAITLVTVTHPLLQVAQQLHPQLHSE